LEAPADVRTLFGERAGDRFGVALASGDVNQSGPPDLIVGAPSSAASAPRPGVAYVYAGGGSFGTSAPEKLSAGFAGDEFGAAVAFVGDLDLDALGEFLVGASGRVYGYERARGASSSLRRGVIGGGADGDRFGAALAACGDVNGDRYEDVLIGAPGADAPEAGGGMLVDAGAASLYFGGPDFNPAADWEAFGTRAGESFGAALAAGGDLNADGFGDWLVCAPFGGSEERGEALAFFGGTLPDRIADARLEGERPGARLGASLAILGEPLPGEFARVALVEGAGDGGTLREFEVRRWWLEPLAPRWPVSAQREIRWSGAEPADVWLVRDGASPLKIASAAGGARENTLAVTVPAPVGAARIRLTAADAGVTGLAESEAIAITNTVALGTFAARRVPGEGIVLEWTTTPNVADGGVASYRIYRAPPGFPIGERIADGVSGTSLAYAEKVRGAKYTLAAVSAAGEELVLGETSLEAAPVGLRVYPVPVRSGDAVVELAPPLGADGRTAADFELSVYDVSGRKVETLARGSVQTDIGVLRLSWSGRDREGNRVKAGLYFVRAESRSAGFRLDRRVVLTR
jgi:hypothetical protein